MKILIVTTMVPFQWGGAEELATSLQSQLVKRGHSAELLRIPFQWEPAEQIPSQMLFVRSLELSEVDLVIGMKFPAYLIRHERKKLWLLHQYRQAYDLFDAGQTNIGTSLADIELRQAIHSADNLTFQECQDIFTISDVVSSRLKGYNNVDSTVLPFPVNDPDMFRGGISNGYILAAGRINTIKRQHLLVEAMAHTSKSTRLIVAGPPETDADADRLRNLISKYDLHDRVEIDLRFLTRSEYARYVNESTAVAYIPFDEDAVGYVTLEAAAAGKPVITAVDSGGILGFVTHDSTGWVSPPSPKAIAVALDQAMNSERSAALGAKARSHLVKRNIDWPSTIDRLLA